MKLQHDLVSLSNWVKDMRVELLECPIPVIEHNVRRACIEACERGLLVRENLPEIPVVEGRDTYELPVNVPDHCVHTIIGVCLGGRHLSDGGHSHTSRLSNNYVYSEPHIANGYSIPDRGFLQLLRAPKYNSRYLGNIDTIETETQIQSEIDPDLVTGPVPINNVYAAQIPPPTTSGYFVGEEDGLSFDGLTGFEPYATSGRLYQFTGGSTVSPNSVLGETNAGPLHVRAPTDPAVIGLTWIPTFGTSEYVIDPVPLLKEDGTQFLNNEVFAESGGVAIEDLESLYWVLNENGVQIFTPTSTTTISEEQPLELNYSDKVGLEVIVSIKPTREALEVPGVLYKDYFETIRTGALSFLHAVKGKPWSDQNVSARYKREFEIELNRARQSIDRGFTNKSHRIRPRRFV